MYLFGLETEFLLARRSLPPAVPELTPLTHRDLTFATLEPLLPQNAGDFAELAHEPPHSGRSPYLIEGYHWPAPGPDSQEVLVKGIEIRTPKQATIEAALLRLESLMQTLQDALAPERLALVAIGHHPVERDFFAPRNGRRIDYWRWGLTAMHTFGPDINLSPSPQHPSRQETWKRWSGPETRRRIDHYGAALATFSWNSPWAQGQLWNPGYSPKGSGHVSAGHSLRTFRRSAVAPAVELHPDEDLRYEFKLWEMTPSSLDLACGCLLVWTLLEHPSLDFTGETDLRTSLEVSSVLGFEDPETRSRAAHLLMALESQKGRVLDLPVLSHDSTRARILWEAAFRRLTDRLEKRLTPASQQPRTFQEALLHNAHWNTLAAEIHPC